MGFIVLFTLFFCFKNCEAIVTLFAHGDIKVGVLRKLGGGDIQTASVYLGDDRDVLEVGDVLLKIIVQFNYDFLQM